MNHTPERPALGLPVRETEKACGWCVSTHIADIKCICTEPCKDKKGNAVGWCTAIDGGDPFSVSFVVEEKP